MSIYYQDDHVTLHHGDCLDRTCTECGEPVDRDGLTTGECGGGGGQKCGECFACSCDGSC